MHVATPSLAHAFDVYVDLAPILDLKNTHAGHRRIIGITGGRVEGPRLFGRILNGGADWQVLRGDGTADLEARYTIEAEDGSLIYVQNVGYRAGPPEVLARIAAGEPVDPSEYYFRTSPRFETAAPAHDWLNRTLFVGSAARLADQVQIRFYEVT